MEMHCHRLIVPLLFTIALTVPERVMAKPPDLPIQPQVNCQQDGTIGQTDQSAQKVVPNKILYGGAVIPQSGGSEEQAESRQPAKTKKKGLKTTVVRKVNSETPVVIAAYALDELLHEWAVVWDRALDQIKVEKRYLEMEKVKHILSLIESGIEPDSWVKRGGVGKLEYMAPTHALIVKHHPRVHEQIQSLLVSLYHEQLVHRENCEQMVKKNRFPRRAKTVSMTRAPQQCPSCPAYAPKGKPITEILKKRKPMGLIVTSEGKTFTEPITGSSEESSAEAKAPSLATGTCFELELDEKTGQTRYRVQVQLGVLTFLVKKDKNGRGEIKISLRLAAKEKTKKEVRKEEN